MKHFILALVALAIMVPTFASAKDHDFVRLRSAADDSVTFGIEYLATETMDPVYIGDVPLVRDADGGAGAPLFLNITFTQAAVDSISYAADYYIGGVKVAAGSTVSKPAASGGVYSVDLDPAVPYEAVVIRILNLDGSGVEALTGVKAWLTKAYVVGAVDAS